MRLGIFVFHISHSHCIQYHKEFDVFSKSTTFFNQTIKPTYENKLEREHVTKELELCIYIRV